jgi:acetyl esterase/lipase
MRALAVGVRQSNGYLLEDMAYGTEPRQQLDLYIPYQAVDDLQVVFIHGGNWPKGHRIEYRFVGNSFARAGFATAVIGYRLYPEVRFPDFVFDAAQALAWLQHTGPVYGFDKQKTLIIGHSAGAQIGALLAFDPQYGLHAGFERGKLAAVAGLAGVYSMRPERNPVYADLFQAAAAESYRAMRPVQWLSPNGVPLYMLHGRRDELVACRSAERMYKEALLFGHPVYLRVEESYGHMQPLLDLLPWRRRHDQLMNEMLRFAREDRS